MGYNEQYEDDEFDYKPESLDSAIFLSDVPVEIMKENISNQFTNPIDYRKNDIVATFIDNYNASLEIEADDDEYENLDELRTEFIDHVKSLFEEKLQVGFPDLDDNSDDDIHDIIHYTYRFFIKNIKKNFVNVILNYIDNNKSTVCSALEKKKDITTMSIKKEMSTPEDTLIVSNMQTVIERILDSYREMEGDCDVEDFIKNTDYSSPSFETQYVTGLYENDLMTGNFLPQYIEMVSGDFMVDIETKVMSKYIKTHRK